MFLDSKYILSSKVKAKVIASKRDDNTQSFTESPGPPSGLRVSDVTNTSAVLSWSPPVNDGGRPLSEIFYTITATGKKHIH